MLGPFGGGFVLDDLTKYYRAKGISAVGFRCPMASSCRAVCAKFAEAREAFVGTEYERGTLPRVAFLSLDPAWDIADGDPARRTFAAMREWEESKHRPIGGAPDFPKVAHWYQTHKFAFELLSPAATARGVRLAFPDVHKYFAHTNSAKCKDIAKGTAQGRRTLFDNCAQFIPGEIELLCPDVLVAQGAPARDALKGAFPVLASQRMTSDKSYQYELVQIASRPVLKIAMSHPAAWQGGRYPREVREAWSWYMDIGHRFLLHGPSALAGKA